MLAGVLRLGSNTHANAKGARADGKHETSLVRARRCSVLV